MRVELIQNSAISFSVCINDKYNRLEGLLISLKSKFKIKVFNEVTLYTIRNFDLNSLNSLNEKTSKILIEQRTKETLQQQKRMGETQNGQTDSMIMIMCFEFICMIIT